MANKRVMRPCGWCGVPQTARDDRKHFAVCEKRGQTSNQFVVDRLAGGVAQFDITMHYVNQAVAAERERCAKIADEEKPCWKCDCGEDHTATVVARIRGGE